MKPADCDLAKSPKDSTACLDDGVGIFVSPKGGDDATGSKAQPVKSIAKGVELAAARGLPRVYVCEGTYDRNVEVRAPVSIFGGLACDWTPSAGTRPKLAPPKDIALRVTKVDGAVLFEDIDVVGSADAATPGDSAIAMFVSESANVMLRNVKATAGAGTPGKKGESRSNYTGATATKGGDANAATAGAGASCTCVDATGSKGGNGGGGSGAGVTDGSATPPVGTANGGGASSTTTCNPGQPGANGAASPAGNVTTSSGTLSSTGWTPAAQPASAPNGNPAQGGGGGGPKTNINSAGGGGACGGCGGAGGGPGTNGGSSFGLLSFNSTLSIDGGSLTTGAAGRGGSGGEGQVGQIGGAPGAGACNGGPGGNGAGGSGGGGGAGGHSVPVAFVGPEPRVSGATLTPGAKGDGGDGGLRGEGPGNPGAVGTPGPAGKAQSSLSL